MKAVWRFYKFAGILFLAMVCHASATVYQVGPTEPYPNLFSVAPLLAPGDVVQVDGNVTYTGGVVFSNNGTAANPITIQGIAVNGMRPVLAQTTGFSGTGGPVVAFTGSHYVMEGFDITQGSDPNAGAAFYSSADDITLIDSAVHDCTVAGISSSASAGSLTLKYVEVFNCGSGSTGNQVYAQSNLTAYPAATFEMEFCYIHDGNGGDNVKTRVPRTLLYYNWIEGAWLHELDLDGADPSAQASGALAGVQGVADVVGNVLLKDPGSKGFIVNIGDTIGWTNGLYRFVNNTAVLSSSSAVANPVALNLTDLVRSVEVYNNLFCAEGGAPISVLNTAKLFPGWPCTIVGSNNWVPSGSSLIPSTWTNTVTGPNPQVVNVAAYNFIPLAGGPLAGAGATFTPDPPGLPFPSPLAVPVFLPPTQESYLVNQALARTANTPIDIGAYAVPPAPWPGYQLPVAFNVSAQLVNHLPATIPVLANDTDSSGTPLSINAVGAATSGTASVSGTNVVYAPSTTFSGSDSFTYSISDGYGVATATVSATYPGRTLYQVGPTETYPDLGTVAPLLMPGDIVQVDGGVTYPGGVTFRNSGTPGNKIIIQGVRINGQRPQIAGTVGFSGAGAFAVRCLGSHYVVEGFDITTGTYNSNVWRGFYNVADDVTLADSAIHDCACNGISNSDSAGSLSLQYDEIYNCGYGLLEHQIYAGSSNALYPHAVLDIEYCYIHNGTGGNNIKSRVARTQVYYNWIEGAYYHEFDLDGADPGDQAPGTASLVQQVGDIVGNVIVKDPTTHGLVANVGGDGTGWSDGRYRFVNNTIIVPSAPIYNEMIFQLKNAVQSIDIYNNLIYRFGGGPVNLLGVVDWYVLSPATVIGANNWLPHGTNRIPTGLSNDIAGANLNVVNAAAFNFTPLAGGDLAGAGATSTPDPPGMPFPSPLQTPLFDPPMQAAYPLGQAVPRVLNNPIDIGALPVAEEPAPGGYALPVAVDDSFQISNTAPVSIPISSLGTDANGLPITVLYTGPASFGTVTVSGGNIIYRPASSFAGLDSFTYTVQDGIGLATGVINISSAPPVSPPPGAPTTTALVLSKDPVPNLPGVYFTSFSYPAMNRQGHTAFMASISGTGVTSTSNQAIWADEGTEPKVCIARRGTATPGISGATFYSFCDPVYNNNDLVAFVATVAGSGIGRANSVGIWSDYPNGFLSLAAHQGQQAPGCASGAVFTSFSELALPDQGGVVFLGGLGNSPVGSPVRSNSSPISTANDQGIWAVDTSGTLQLVVQLGTFHPVTGKLITALSILPAAPYVAGQTRSFDQATGDIVYRATFKDGTSGIFLVTFP